MITSKHLIYTALATLMAASGCSKDEQPAAAEAKREIPASYTEARKKGMVEEKYNAELAKLRKSAANPVIKINDQIAAKTKELEAARAAKAPAADIAALEGEIAKLKDKAVKAETKYRRQMMSLVRAKMMQEAAAVEGGAK